MEEDNKNTSEKDSDRIEIEIEKFRNSLDDLRERTKHGYCTCVNSVLDGDLLDSIDQAENPAEIYRNKIKPNINSTVSKAAFKRYIDYKIEVEPDENMDFLFSIERRLDKINIENKNSSLDKAEVMDKYLENPEIEQFVKHVEDEYKDHKFYKDLKLLPVLAYETGCRREKLVSIEKGDINMDRKMIQIRDAKGGKNRVVHFSDVSKKLLKDKIEDLEHKDQIFNINPQQSWYYTAKIGRDEFGYRGPNTPQKEDPSPRLTPHWFRHSFATNWCMKRLKDGESRQDVITHLKGRMGHDDKETTETYLHVAKSFMEKNMYDEHGELGLDV